MSGPIRYALLGSVVSSTGYFYVAMSILERILGPRSQIDRDLGYFGLGTWWLSAFSKAERQHLEEVFEPVRSAGSGPSTPEADGPAFATAAGFLVALAGGLGEKPEDRNLAARVLARAEERALAENDLVGLHFVYQETIRLHYKWRDQFRDAVDLAFAACHKQMQIAAETAQALREKFGDRPLPPHFGFQRAASILEKRAAYKQALEICRRARQQGWEGNWTWRVQRITRKLHERGYPVVSVSSSGMSQI